jgi:hypothetical protein
MNLGFLRKSSNVSPGETKIFPSVAASDIRGGSCGVVESIGGGGACHSGAFSELKFAFSSFIEFSSFWVGKKFVFSGKD